MDPEQDLYARWGVVGHAWAIEALEHAVATGRAAHAFLLAGPHGIGKTTLARALARRLMCSGQLPPCGECAACVKNLRGTSPDVRVIEGLPPNWKLDKDGPAGPPRKSDRERRTLRIEQVRELQPWLATAPFESPFKVAILRRFEEASEETANAFLKTLEEPPRHVVLILTAQDSSLILPTIASRCQKLTLRPLPLEEIENALTARWHVEPGRAHLLARLSAGRVGWAVRAAADPSLLEAREQALTFLNSLLNENRAERITRAGELAKDAAELPQLLELWLTWWRDVLLLQSGDGLRVTNVDREELLRRQAEQFPTVEVQGALKATRAAARHLEQNANARLVLEVLALSLPRR